MFARDRGNKVPEEFPAEVTTRRAFGSAAARYRDRVPYRAVVGVDRADPAGSERRIGSGERTRPEGPLGCPYTESKGC